MVGRRKKIGTEFLKCFCVMRIGPNWLEHVTYVGVFIEFMRKGRVCVVGNRGIKVGDGHVDGGEYN